MPTHEYCCPMERKLINRPKLINCSLRKQKHSTFEFSERVSMIHFVFNEYERNGGLQRSPSLPKDEWEKSLNKKEEKQRRWNSLKERTEKFDWLPPPLPTPPPLVWMERASYYFNFYGCDFAALRLFRRIFRDSWNRNTKLYILGNNLWWKSLWAAFTFPI